MNLVLPADKRDVNQIFAYLIYAKMKERASIIAGNPRNSRITFSDARHVLGAVFRIPKKFHFVLIKEMEKRGLVEIRPYHYILLKYHEEI